MTDKDKIVLISFITRTGMYIPGVCENGTVSFLEGYETGRNKNCDFTLLVRKHIEENLSVEYSSNGWPGQIKRYAYKKSMSWTTAFKKIGLDIIASEENGGLNKKMQEIIKSRILDLIDRIVENGNPCFDNSWIEEWNSLCAIKSEWFKKLWTEKEYSIIKSIGKKIAVGEVFEEMRMYKPTKKL